MSFNSIFVLKIFIFIIICCSNFHKAQKSRNMHSDSIRAVLEYPKEWEHKSCSEQRSGSPNTCEPQLMINIRVNPSFHIKKIETFLILDEVYDPHKRLKAKIMAPYLIEISRGEPVMMYPLQFTKSFQFGNGMGESQLPNEPEHTNCNVAVNNNQMDNNEKSDGNAIIIPQNSSISTKTSLDRSLTFSDNSNNPKQQSYNEVIQKVNKVFSPITKSENLAKLGPRKESQNTKAYWCRNVLQTPISMKFRNVSDKPGVDDHRNRIQFPPRHKIKKFHNQIPNKMDYKNVKFLPDFPSKTSNVGVERNVTSQLLNKHNLGQIGQMKMFLRNGTLSKSSEFNEFSNYYASDSNQETTANNYVSGFLDQNIRNSMINENQLESILDTSNQLDTKVYRPYQLLVDNAGKPKLHITDAIDTVAEKSLNMDNGPSIRLQFVNNNGEHLKHSKFNLKGGEGDPFSGLKDKQRQVHSTNILPGCWQDVPFQNSVLDSLSDKTSKNHKKIDRAMDEDLYYALKGEFQNKISKNFDDALKRSSKKLKNHFKTGPIISQVTDMKHLKNSDDQYRSDLNIVDPLIESSSENSFTSIVENPISPHLSFESLQERNKLKRSYLFYDDMEMTGTLDNIEDIYDNLLPVQAFASTWEPDFNGNVQPCAACGGKGRKPPEKGDTGVRSSESRINNCNCRSKRIKCSCVPNKMTQSVGDACVQNEFTLAIPYYQDENFSETQRYLVENYSIDNNHQLFIPKDDRPTREDKHKQKRNSDIEHFENLNLNPETILAMNSIKPNLITSFLEFQDDLINRKNNIFRSGSTRNPRIMRNIDDSTEKHSVRKIAELGYFPTSMNMLERCPNNKNRLCLNMLDDIVPAFTIKVKMPFRENTVVFSNVFKVKIIKVISDTTTKDALQISVDLINESIESREFSVSVNKCPTACVMSAKTSVKKFLLPHVGETINFLLPLIVQTNNLTPNKFHCEVVIKTIISNDSHSDNRDRQKRTEINSSQIDTKQEKNVVVAVRQLTIQPGKRCLCIWKCRCHCVSKLETYVDFNICQELDFNSESAAGLLVNSIDVKNGVDNPQSDEQNFFHTNSNSKEPFQYNGFLWNALLLFLLMILIGLLKAIFGICLTSVDKCGYDYLQPGRTYYDSSNCRHFWVNAFFFIIFPFLFWCKCFTPSAEDLLVASTEWPCQNSSTGLLRQSHNIHKCLFTDEEDEDVIFNQHIQGQSQTNKIQSHLNDKCTSNCRKNYQTFHDTDEDKANTILLKNEKQKSPKNIAGSRLEGGGKIRNSFYDLYDFELALNDDIFDDDEEVNTKFILKALAESRESLQQLQINNQSISLESISEESQLIRTSAEEFVHILKEAQIVYRTFDEPIGNIKNIPSCFKYCIQGYFLPSLGIGYEFVNYNPLAQHRCVSMDGKTIQVLRPPNLLCPKDFSRKYEDKYEVLKVGDLTQHPPEHVPCINISALAAVATSMAKLTSDQSRKHDVITPSTCLRSKLDVYESSSCIAMDNKVPETELYATHYLPLKNIDNTYLIDTIEQLDHDLLQSNETVNSSNDYSTMYKE